ncbi:hypothetical protein L228DRAFT_148793 [Xylona heveae TC161]|uniref:Uncharacterized protein n=1 Tax=Xylona heveae (strain CBS 132557 / TC161) TaxID=1328760 RepID=A0A165GIH8_XYLHT|nr:hypothetical protein L228DRAFT_148793 [Xylona heveae TC161]KZF22224.1 hypothetical protein L228DRAFT_148793 [Xylona heveae TC161]
MQQTPTRSKKYTTVFSSTTTPDRLAVQSSLLFNSSEMDNYGSRPLVRPVSKLPTYLRFPLLVLLNLTLSTLLYSLAADHIAGELAGVSRSVNKWGEVIGLIAWRSIELGCGWFFNFDGVDLGCLTLLSHLPPLYLLVVFYSIHPKTVFISMCIDVFTTYISFRLLRPLSLEHNTAGLDTTFPNLPIIEDVPLRLYTTLLAAGIYGVAFFSAFSTWLPVYLITYFDGVRDLTFAHSATLPLLIASFIPVGYSAREFLFTPSAGARKDLGEIRKEAFNPETATFGQTLRHNLWFFPKRTKILIARTVTLIIISTFNTWLQTYVTIEGVNASGAVGWAGVWGLAAIVTSLTFWWVGNV